MDVVYERCCGLDVHKDSIVACIFSGGRDKEIRSFGAMTSELLTLIDWIKEKNCQCVAMESTGSYWKPIYNLLEMEEIDSMVVNAQHIKAVPGRKTDVKDAEWISDLLRHGLLKRSFIPKRDQRELRELVRYRKSIIEERTRELNRIQKVLEGANIKLSSVVSTIDCISARNMLKALVEGKDDPLVLSAMAKGSLRGKQDELTQALTGLIGKHQQMILNEMLQHIEYLEGLIQKLDEEVGERLHPFEEALEQVDSIPGIGRRSAEIILAEIGTDMSVFASAEHLASWAGMCPGNNESAGKRKSGKTRDSNKILRSTLVECAMAANRTKGTYLADQYKRIAARRGSKRAAIAVGHSILVVTYHILKNKSTYQDLGSGYLEERHKTDIIRKSVKRLESLGVKVTIEDVA